ATYRLKLVNRYLEEAEEAYRRRDFRMTVAASQLCVENATKAVIAIYRIPSWSYDPSPELREVARQLPEDIRDLAYMLADAAYRLASEHGRATYGEPLRGLTPWDIYGETDASEALNTARNAYNYMDTIFKRMKVDGGKP
ncbi:MAG: HEPN domain-containing protein, partial [Candidatus Bathyarchaeota archaeon]|nr:HEPN domain-containing protein [Candidatus Bathyarchaeota archaeon]